LLKEVLSTNGKLEAVALGCGCFWHVEAALRQLRGVVTTEACYAGGHTAWPTYEDVCGDNTEHAEVVSVVYDPEVCPSSVLIDCFLALHDPTKVRAHGKHALHTGQYRSCVFVESAEMEILAKECLERCREQLGKDLSTEVRRMGSQDEQKDANAEAGAFGQGWCWRAEDRHQRHDERIKGRSDTQITGLSATEWLKEYGRRTASIVGSSLESSLHPDDDGMAMMMI
jgi:peptide-methionine (S)-S-oxide reductase